MKGPWDYASGLLDLPTLKNPEEMKASFRQSMAALSRASSEDEFSPLEGLNPTALARGVKVALTGGFFDDLDWLAAPAAGTALYALAAALPNGPEQRDLGRRVLARLQSANAETFVAMATRIALSTGKGLSTPGIRSRVALTFELPIALGLADGGLALALASSRDLSREWVVVPSTGSLTARRLTARLIERAAREAAKRALQGDEHAIRIFRGGAVHDGFRRLLEDREGLVWRHVAVARGLVAPWVEELEDEIRKSMSPDLSPTEWRRGATSLAAMVAVERDMAMRVLTSAIEKGAVDRDPGVATAIVWGATRAGETEPELASQLLLRVANAAPLETAEGLVDLLQDFGRAPFADKAVDAVRKNLKKIDTANDDGAAALALLLTRELEPNGLSGTLAASCEEALSAFVNSGARSAHALTTEMIELIDSSLSQLEDLTPDLVPDADAKSAGVARRTSFRILRALDAALLERTLLGDLVRLGGDTKQEELLERSKERLATWMLDQESVTEKKSSAHVTVAMRRLRTLLHLVDSDLVGGEGARAQAERRWLRVVGLLLSRLSDGTPGALRRMMFATLARSFDALVRAELLTVADIVLVCAHFFEEESELQTLAEASMDPELIHSLTKYAALAAHSRNSIRRPTEPSTRPSLQMKVSIRSMSAVDSIPPIPLKKEATNPDIAALESLANELFMNTTSRAEALRTAIVRVANALKSIELARSLTALSGENSPLVALENALAAIAQMSAGARQKTEAAISPANGEYVLPLRSPVREVEPLSMIVSRLVAHPGDRLSLEVIHRSMSAITLDVPRLIRQAVFRLLTRLEALPLVNAAQGDGQIAASNEQLPAWVPSRRTLGGFYLLRSLGGGAAGSVLLVCRVEERHDPEAERFALKVPDYSATAARSLSEDEFLKMFRAEASALIDLPMHANLARFVTFDAGARPKPILVMEMVEGVTLEHLIASRALDMMRGIEVILDILKGLEAMHGVGVGHLDVKPSNVVLRKGTEGVLVDFGLSGRNIRPGCATGPYGAPEVWGAIDASARPTPQAADVYAVGCLMFEVLTGKTLIEAQNELALVAMHIAHDGQPARLLALADKPVLRPLVMLLTSMLRRSPEKRPSVAEVRQKFNGLAQGLVSIQWPLA